MRRRKKRKRRRRRRKKKREGMYFNAKFQICFVYLVYIENKKTNYNFRERERETRNSSCMSFDRIVYFLLLNFLLIK